VALDPTTKRWLYASFLLSFGLSVLALHGTPDGASYAPFGAPEGSYSLLRACIPSGATALLFPALGLAHLAALGIAGARLSGRAPLASLAPAGILCVTQALWFSLPVAARQWHWLPGVDALRADQSGWYFFWIAIGHSVQYLWITAWYARAAGGAPRSAAFVGKALLAGCALWATPALLFAPDLLGRPPYEAGLGVMIAAAVNLHHFILDGAIWKLRDGRVARVLLRPAERGAVGAPPGRRVLSRALLALGALGLCAILLAHFGRQAAASALDAGELVRAERILDRLAFVGHDSGALRLRLGSERVSRGDLDGARRALARSLSLHESEPALLALAAVEERRGDAAAALALYERVLADSPRHAEALRRAGLLWRGRGDLAKARELLARAVRADPRVREAHVALRDVEEALALGSAP
jgi:tetratricopeptide (TPR) repeat protein